MREIIAFIKMLLKGQGEPPSPAGILDANQISKVGNSINILGIPGEIWKTTVADTNSMLPLIDNGDIAILTNGFLYDKLEVGDVVVYDVQLANTIIHRIIDIDETEDDWVYTCKGDNNAGRDPYQLLDEHIKWLLVAVIYCKKER